MTPRHCEEQRDKAIQAGLPRALTGARNDVWWLFRQLFLLPVRLYRVFLSPYFGNQCRHQPTCSVYMIEAVEKHGIIKGGWLGLRRVLSCHPLSHRPPYDPVP